MNYASLFPSAWWREAGDSGHDDGHNPQRRFGLFALRRCARAKKRRRADRISRALDKQLGLNGEQRCHLHLALDELKALRAELQADSSKLRSAVRELLAEPQLDRAKAMGLLRNQTRAIDERAAELVMAFAGFSDSLDEAQRHALTDWLESGSRRNSRRGWRPWRWRPQR